MRENISTDQNVRVQKSDRSISWLTFPVHERLSGPDAQRFLDNVQLSYQKLEAIAQNGQSAEKARARLALKAYSRVDQLLNRIRDLQEEMKQTSK